VISIFSFFVSSVVMLFMGDCQCLTTFLFSSVPLRFVGIFEIFEQINMYVCISPFLILVTFCTQPFQGLNFVAGMLLLVLKDEEKTFCVLHTLLNTILPGDSFIDPGAVEFRRLTELNFDGVEVVN